jgi:FGGY-family pentulose kinase
MAEGPYLIGIDGGTESVRVGIFDREGTPVVFHGVEYETRYPRAGWAEQNPDEWWSSLTTAVKGAMDEGNISPEEIEGISMDTTSCTVVAMDEKDRHMRPALLWMDVRAAEQARRLQETDEQALKYNGFGAVSAEWMPSKALWLKDNEPDIYNSAARICEYGDWMVHRPTGEWTASISNASIRWYYDRGEGGWPESFYGAVGLDDVLEKFPPKVLDTGEVVGGLTKEAAEEIGLRPDIPVAQGGVDAFAGAVGLGVVEPGKIALITGSSHVIIGQVAEPIHGKGFFGAYTDAMVPGQYTVEGGQVSTGSIVAWFKNRYAKGAAEEAQNRGVDIYDVLNEWAVELPPGSEGLVVLDYFQGNRTPYTDPLARGAMWGLSLRHGEGHIFRAIIEGVCYGTEHIFRTMRENDFEPQEIVAAGGCTKSDLWMQIHADVANVPISFTKVGDAPVLGAAMLAAVGAGIYPDVQEAAKNMVYVERTIEPDQERHEEYRFYVDKYVETYPLLRELMHDVARHESGQSTGEKVGK